MRTRGNGAKPQAPFDGNGNGTALIRDTPDGPVPFMASMA